VLTARFAGIDVPPQSSFSADALPEARETANDLDLALHCHTTASAI
jgi:hypothetical protein